MKKAFVLMTAMPPTKGHLNLIRFAATLDVSQVIVLVTTQPHEPFASERFLAVKDAIAHGHDRFISQAFIEVRWINQELEQDPKAEGFWEMWDGIMLRQGFSPGDYAVSSEPYGATLAKRLKGEFYPYDPQRQLYYTKATNIREHLGDYFHDILPEFQPHLMSRITIFGAESCGKTTLSESLAREINGHWMFEWARPFLETVGPEITRDKMIQIWHGQAAIQEHAKWMKDKPFIVQDTDLFSTIGYWEQPHWKEVLGPVPPGLISAAQRSKSDLYIIPSDNIPFEQDPLRYGGDRRESPTQYWVDIAEKYHLNYVVLTETDRSDRLAVSMWHAQKLLDERASDIYYDRRGL
jgi:NadR type nicotinamide-nucleotide adenylyltransferase